MVAAAPGYGCESRPALFEIQAAHRTEFRAASQLPPPTRDGVYTLFRPTDPGRPGGAALSRPFSHATEAGPRFDPAAAPPPPRRVTAAAPSHRLAHCFWHLANLPTSALDRLSRYEYRLWRQAAQILVALDHLHRREPQERQSARFCLSAERDLPLCAR
jgi:hypothetical protein